jgi:hypothetical protein
MHRLGKRRPSPGAAFIAALAALALLLAVLATPVQGGNASKAPSRHGRELLAEYILPASVLSQYVVHKPLVPVRPDAPKRRLTLAEAVPWHGPGLSVGAGHNPYNLVLTVTGLAPAAGEVRSAWQIGWEYQDSDGQRRRFVVPQTDTARSGVAAGSEVRLTGTSGPISFREPRNVLPFVGLVQLDNLNVTQVSVQVWSGTAPLDWLPAWTPQLKAALLIALALATWWSVRAMRSAVQAPAPLPYRLSRPGELTAQPAAAATPPPPAEAAPAPPPPSHTVRVAANLFAVLTQGLTVESVPDDLRPRRKRPRKG